MDHLINKTLIGISNKKYLLTDIVVRGAQGVLFNESSGEFIVKLLNIANPNLAENEFVKLKKLFDLSLPERFINPKDIICQKNENNEIVVLGYAMVRVKGHESLSKLLIPSSNETFSQWYNKMTGGLRRRLYLAHQIAHSFYLLHQNNIAYCDISGNNILIAKNKNLASVCMIDIDNLYTPGCSTPGILGTMRYMAPEILKSQLLPDVLTDDYSLAIILFELLKCGHPFIGDFVETGSPDVEEQAYKGLLPYVDDVSDNFNHSTNMIDSDYIFNKKLDELFSRTFTKGKNNRLERASAMDFSIACLEASNAVIKCPHCQNWFFPKQKKCPWCDKLNRLPPYIAICERFPNYNMDISVDADCKHIKTYFLRPEINEVTENYMLYTICEDNVNIQNGNIKTAFKIDCLVKGKTKLINTSKENLFLRHQNKGEYLAIEPKQSIEIASEDALYFANDEVKPKSHEEIINCKNNKELKMRRFMLFKNIQEGLK